MKPGLTVYKNGVVGRLKNRRIIIHRNTDNKVEIIFNNIIPTTDERIVQSGEILKKKYLQAAIQLSPEGAMMLCEMLMCYLKSTQYVFEKP